MIKHPWGVCRAVVESKSILFVVGELNGFIADVVMSWQADE